MRISNNLQNFIVQIKQAQEVEPSSANTEDARNTRAFGTLEEEAYRDAINNLIAERAGTYINSGTGVENNQLTKDEIVSRYSNESIPAKGINNIIQETGYGRPLATGPEIFSGGTATGNNQILGEDFHNITRKFRRAFQPSGSNYLMSPGNMTRSYGLHSPDTMWEGLGGLPSSTKTVGSGTQVTSVGSPGPETRKTTDLGIPSPREQHLKDFQQK